MSWPDIKKSPDGDELDRSDVAARRQMWRQTQRDFNPKQLVFLDEHGTLQPEDFLNMDNLASQKVCGVREAIESAQAQQL